MTHQQWSSNDQTFNPENLWKEFCQYVYSTYNMEFIGLSGNHLMFSHPSCPSTLFVGILSPVGNWDFYTREGFWISNPTSCSPLFVNGGGLPFDLSEIDFHSFEQILLFDEKDSLKKETDRMLYEKARLAEKKERWGKEAKQARLAKQACLAEEARIAAEEARLAEEAKRMRKLRILLKIKLKLLRSALIRNQLFPGLYDLLKSFDSEQTVSSFLGSFSLKIPTNRLLISMFNIVFGSVPFLVKTLKTHEPGRVNVDETERNQWFKFLGMGDDAYQIVWRFFFLTCIALRSVNNFDATEGQLNVFADRIACDSNTVLGGSYRKTPGNAIQAFLNWINVLTQDNVLLGGILFESIFKEDGLLLATGLPKERPIAWQGLEQQRNKRTLDAIMAQKFKELPTGKKLEEAKTQSCTQYKTAFLSHQMWTTKKVSSSHRLVNALAILYSRLKATIDEIVVSQIANGFKADAIIEILDKAIAEALRNEW